MCCCVGVRVGAQFERVQREAKERGACCCARKEIMKRRNAVFSIRLQSHRHSFLFHSTNFRFEAIDRSIGFHDAAKNFAIVSFGRANQPELSKMHSGASCTRRHSYCFLVDCRLQRRNRSRSDRCIERSTRLQCGQFLTQYFVSLCAAQVLNIVTYHIAVQTK